MSATYRSGAIALRVLALLALAALAGCGSGSNGAADLGEGGSTTQNPPVATKVSLGTAGGIPSVIGTSPFTAQLSGGSLDGTAWVIPSGSSGTIDFTTPADRVAFEALANYASASAGQGARKPSAIKQPSQAVNAPFDTAMYVRGSVRDDWAASAQNKLVEVADNVLEVKIPLAAGDYQFKIADAGWTGETNCGADTDPTPVTVGQPFTMQCDALSQNLLLTITTAGDYKFTFNASNVDATTVTVALDTGNGGGGTPEPEPKGLKITVFDADGNAIGDPIEGTDSTTVDQVRRGAESRIGRVLIENLGDIGDLGIEELEWTADPRFTPAAIETTILFRRPDGDYSDTSISIDGQSYECTATADGQACQVTGVPVLPYSRLDMAITSNGETQNVTAFPGDASLPIYTVQGSPAARLGEPAGLPTSADEVILYYKRPGPQTDATYSGWGLHLFPLDPATGDWTLYAGGEFPYEGIDPEWGAYFRIALPGQESPAYSANPDPLDTFPNVLGFIIHKGDEKDPGPDQAIRIAEDGNLLFVVSGVNEVSNLPPGGGTVARIVGASAHWVNLDTIIVADATLAGAASLELLYSADGSIQAGLNGIGGTYETFALGAGTNPELPNMLHLAGKPAFALPATALGREAELLRGQLVVLARDADGNAIGGTFVQTAGALDAMYADAAYGKPLGVSYAGGTPAVSVWAPTALTDPGVILNLYNEDGSRYKSVAMTYDETSGIWTATGTPGWDRKYYAFKLHVYSYATNSIVTNEVTDPWSVSLAADSARSQFVNLEDPDTKPAGWDTLTKPAVAAAEDIAIYELHIRDFSIADPTVPEADRGKYLAFSADEGLTAGRQHLKDLADAGLTHVHLLPAFDIATVRERRADRVELDDPVAALCAANSDAQSLCTTDAGKTLRQAMADAVATNQLDKPAQITDWLRGLDGFNWGYDPWHYGVPEGSYASDPDGIARIREFRAMVAGLADVGLHTVMDVVYNHTNSSGQSGTSVLDKIVPGYYHRRSDTTGNVLNNSCCSDTASEFRMMEKLMIDTAEVWARDYKVDGLRFDIMGFHPLDAMLRLQDRMRAIDPSFYIYGEGWNFGDVQNDKRFVQATQKNLGGTGIGSFSDRIRDQIRGGGPFDGGAAYVKNQGFVSGWYYDPNAVNIGSADERTALITAEDNIRVWLAGGLKAFRFTDAAGDSVTGADVDYGGQESGYTEDPQEAINYISAHDGETLWDISQYKHPANTPTADRVRGQNVGMSVVLLAEGIPFIHAGADILRSKSLDKNSYDSGDWYNEIDWSLATTKWNQGLPRKADNEGSYPQIQDAFLTVNAAPVAPADLQRAFDHVREMLEIRKSSLLFRLRTGKQIEQRVSFLNTGPFQIPGVIVMDIDGCAEPELTADEAAVITIFNASDDPRTLGYFKDQTWVLHPILAASTDPLVQTAKHDADGFYVPARTTAVFVRTAPAQTSCAPYPRDLYVRGTPNDWANPPDPAYKLEFLGGTSYSVSAPVAAGTQAFKIADADWTADTNCGGATSGESVELGTPKVIACFNDSQNLGLEAPVAGNYTFALDATDLANPTLTVSKTPPFAVDLYIRGSLNDWADPPPESAKMTWDGAGTYRVVLTGLAAQGYAFKVADAGWGGSNGGASNCGSGAVADLTLGEPFALNCDNSSGNINLTVPQAGNYLFAADFTNPATPAIVVEPTALSTDVFVRGSFNDWVDPPPANAKLSELGNGLLKVTLKLTAGAGAFKVADATWNVFNCGEGTVTLGQPVALTCGGSSGNTSFDVPANGYYSFTLDATNPVAPTVTVTGP
jgi:pullulanase